MHSNRHAENVQAREQVLETDVDSAFSGLWAPLALGLLGLGLSGFLFLRLRGISV